MGDRLFTKRQYDYMAYLPEPDIVEDVLSINYVLDEIEIWPKKVIKRTTFNPIEVKMLRWTELLDSEGTRIYDKDLIKMDIHGDGSEEWFIVEIKDGRAPIARNKKIKIELWMINKECRVISSAYETFGSYAIMLDLMEVGK